ncbi:MAG: hypothetical protein ACJ8ER_07740 [Allosphingosinicella sp.]
MMKLVLIASGGLLLATASAPPPGPSGGYPPCSRKVTDRCVQSYERNAPAAAPAAPRAQTGGESELSSVVAAGPPASVADAVRPRPAPAPVAVAAATPAAAPAPVHATAAPSRRVQLAMRAGERG